MDCLAIRLGFPLKVYDRFPIDSQREGNGVLHALVAHAGVYCPDDAQTSDDWGVTYPRFFFSRLVLRPNGWVAVNGLSTALLGIRLL